MSFKFDREKTRKKIVSVLEDVKTKVDPLLLDEYRRLFKQEVSFFRRSWAAAYLLMLYDQDGKFRASANPGRRSSVERKPAGSARQADEAKQARPVEPLPEEEARQLFLNIGRNRRVFPREILGLIYSKASVSREDIGSIRILDNYSFVQVRDSVADTIIEALDGKSFRGKFLTVNYARSRREEEGDDTESQADGQEGRPARSSKTDEAGDLEFPADDSGQNDSEQDDNRPDEEGV
ncbi:MAG: DbpA RNA binding domain-containing protein [Treponema sp.]|jgi:hypothetical protein|nr:DbpA RNA binding domain-containing protein [Treponema sp.]